MKGTIQIRDVVFFYFINFLGAFHSERSSYASQYIQIYLFSWQLPIIFTKNIKYHVFNAVTNSELTKLVPVFTIRPVFPTSVKKVNTSFKNVWRTWGPTLPTLLADLMIFCPIGPTGPTNLKKTLYITIYEILPEFYLAQSVHAKISIRMHRRVIFN